MHPNHNIHACRYRYNGFNLQILLDCGCMTSQDHDNSCYPTLDNLLGSKNVVDTFNRLKYYESQIEHIRIY